MTEDTEKNELIEIVNEFADIAKSDKFEDTFKHDENFRKQIMNITTIFGQFSKNLGVTEYTTADSGYTGDQVLEKYKQSVGSSWKGRKEKSNKIKKITHDEIMNATDLYLQRRNNLLKKREVQRVESGESPRKLEGFKENNKEKLHISGKQITKIEKIPIYKYDNIQQEYSSSSDDDDDDIINNILGIESHASTITPTNLLTSSPKPQSGLRLDAELSKKRRKRRKHRKREKSYSSSDSSNDSEPENKTNTQVLNNVDNYFSSILDGSDSE